MAGKVKDITGQIFGELKVISFSERKDGRTFWKCLCSCGIEKDFDGADLKRGNTKSCGHAKKVDISGKIIGEWKVIKKLRVDKNGKNYDSIYLCECSCGNIKEVKYSNLCSQTTTNCGHLSRRHDDIVSGDIFGEWEVIEKESETTRNNTAMWLCKCSCGVEKYVYGQSLLGGTSTNCGHEHSDGISVGDRFGRLEVVSFYGKRKNGNSIWSCVCDCGNQVNVINSGLKSGTTKSCGCLAAELSSKRIHNVLVNGHFFRYYDWYVLDGEKKINVRSSYEVFVWNYVKYLLKKKILYEPKTFIISPSERYTPDFYIPDIDTWIETKGSFELHDKQKGKIDYLIEKDGIKINVLFWEDIRELCGLRYKTSKSYFDNAKKLNIPIEDYLGNRIYFKYENNY